MAFEEYEFEKRELTIGEVIAVQKANAAGETMPLVEVIQARLKSPKLRWEEILGLGVSDLLPLWLKCMAAVAEAVEEITKQREAEAAIKEVERITSREENL